MASQLFLDAHEVENAPLGSKTFFLITNYLITTY